jgi:hypothetical protein
VFVDQLSTVLEDHIRICPDHLSLLPVRSSKTHTRILENLQDSYGSQSKLQLACEALIAKPDTLLNPKEK